MTPCDPYFAHILACSSYLSLVLVRVFLIDGLLCPLFLMFSCLFVDLVLNFCFRNVCVVLCCLILSLFLRVFFI